jgi:hypothetical protein
MKFLSNGSKKEIKFQRYTGLNFKQLDILAKKIEPLWNESEVTRLEQPERSRKIGGGRSYKIGLMEDRLTAVLMYYKMHITQELVGDLVGLDQSNMSRLLTKMLPLIEKAADPELKNFLERAKNDARKRIGDLSDFWSIYPDLRDVSTDATEQPIYRSKNYETQKKDYSGKTKMHATKVQISVAKAGRILDVSESYPGSYHDKKIIGEEATIEKFDKRIPQRFDSGYQGLKDDNPNHYVIIPAKKSRKKKELSPLEKEHNRANSKRRIVAEHAFSRVKKFKVCSDTFRQPRKQHNQTVRNVIAIINFKWRSRQYRHLD